MSFSGGKPQTSSPVVVDQQNQAEASRQARISELERQGMQATVLSQAAGPQQTTGGRTVLGGFA